MRFRLLIICGLKSVFEKVCSTYSSIIIASIPGRIWPTIIILIWWLLYFRTEQKKINWQGQNWIFISISTVTKKFRSITFELNIPFRHHTAIMFIISLNIRSMPKNSPIQFWPRSGKSIKSRKTMWEIVLHRYYGYVYGATKTYKTESGT